MFSAAILTIISFEFFKAIKSDDILKIIIYAGIMIALAVVKLAIK